MLIDAILDRRDGVPYNAKKLYNYLFGSFKCYEPVTYAMDYGTEEEVQEALCRYILEQDYNPDICSYIRSVKWLENDPEDRTFTFKSSYDLYLVTVGMAQAKIRFKLIDGFSFRIEKNAWAVMTVRRALQEDGYNFTES